MEAGGLPISRYCDGDNAENKNENVGIELVPLPVRPFPARVADLRASPSPSLRRKQDQLFLPRKSPPLSFVAEQQPAVVKGVLARSSWYGQKGGQ